MPTLDNLLGIPSVLDIPNIISNINERIPQQNVASMSLPSGTYVGTQSLSLSVNDPTTSVYYTTDGSDPTVNSTLYTGPISISVSQTVKSIAAPLDVRLRLSNVAGAVYVINAADHLGTAANFTVLAASTVTNTGLTTITGGDLGLYPGTSVTGFPPGVLNPPAVKHVNDAVAQQAAADLGTAYTYYAGVPSTGALDPDLGSLTYTPGVYTNASAVQISATKIFTLDAQGDADAVFIFQIGTTLTLGSSSSVSLINGAQAKNVFWQVGSSATLGTSSVMLGNIMAQASITFNTSASITGRALAVTAAVTLDTNIITAP
jgi:hypothetical protein